MKMLIKLLQKLQDLGRILPALAKIDIWFELGQFNVVFEIEKKFHSFQHKLLKNVSIK